MFNKFVTYALRALATLALGGSYAVFKKWVNADLGPVFTGLATLCMLLHAQPFDLAALLKKASAKAGGTAGVFALFAALCVGTSGCFLHNSPGPSAPADDGVDGGYLNCLETKTHAATLDILPKVTTALATGAYEVELLALAVEYGPGVVYCTVKAAVDELMKIKLDAVDPETAKDIQTRITNGQAYLAARGQ